MSKALVAEVLECVAASTFSDVALQNCLQYIDHQGLDKGLRFIARLGEAVHKTNWAGDNQSMSSARAMVLFKYLLFCFEHLGVGKLHLQEPETVMRSVLTALEPWQVFAWATLRRARRLALLDLLEQVVPRLMAEDDQFAGSVFADFFLRRKDTDPTDVMQLVVEPGEDDDDWEDYEDSCFAVLVRYGDWNQSMLFKQLLKYVEREDTQWRALLVLQRVVCARDKNLRKVADGDLVQGLLEVLRKTSDPTTMQLGMWVLIILLPHVLPCLQAMTPTLLAVMKQAMVLAAVGDTTAAAAVTGNTSGSGTVSLAAGGAADPALPTGASTSSAASSDAIPADPVPLIQDPTVPWPLGADPSDSLKRATATYTRYLYVLFPAQVVAFLKSNCSTPPVVASFALKIISRARVQPDLVMGSATVLNGLVGKPVEDALEEFFVVHGDSLTAAAATEWLLTVREAGRSASSRTLPSSLDELDPNVDAVVAASLGFHIERITAPSPSAGAAAFSSSSSAALLPPAAAIIGRAATSPAASAIGPATGSSTPQLHRAVSWESSRSGGSSHSSASARPSSPPTTGAAAVTEANSIFSRFREMQQVLRSRFVATTDSPAPGGTSSASKRPKPAASATRISIKLRMIQQELLFERHVRHGLARRCRKLQQQLAETSQQLAAAQTHSRIHAMTSRIIATGAQSALSPVTPSRSPSPLPIATSGNLAAAVSPRPMIDSNSQGSAASPEGQLSPAGFDSSVAQLKAAQLELRRVKDEHAAANRQLAAAMEHNAVLASQLQEITSQYAGAASPDHVLFKLQHVVNTWASQARHLPPGGPHATGAPSVTTGATTATIPATAGSSLPQPVPVSASAAVTSAATNTVISTVATATTMASPADLALAAAEHRISELKQQLTALRETHEHAQQRAERREAALNDRYNNLRDLHLALQKQFAHVHASVLKANVPAPTLVDHDTGSSSGITD